MAWYGDPADMRRQAGLWRREAGEVRSRAGEAQRAVDGTQWESTAADTYRGTFGRVISRLHQVADDLDSAAEALTDHALMIEERLEAIRRTEQLAVQWFADTAASVLAVAHKAESIASDGLSMLGDAVGFDVPTVPWLHWPWRPGTLPPSGDRLWLEVADDLRGRGVPLP